MTRMNWRWYLLFFIIHISLFTIMMFGSAIWSVILYRTIYRHYVPVSFQKSNQIHIPTNFHYERGRGKTISTDKIMADFEDLSGKNKYSISLHLQIPPIPNLSLLTGPISMENSIIGTRRHQLPDRRLPKEKVVWKGERSFIVPHKTFTFLPSSALKVEILNEKNSLSKFFKGNKNLFEKYLLESKLFVLEDKESLLIERGYFEIIGHFEGVAHYLFYWRKTSALIIIFSFLLLCTPINLAIITMLAIKILSLIQRFNAEEQRVLLEKKK